MSPSRRVTSAKAIAILGFLVLLSTTYSLRTEVLSLNRIGFSADDARAAYDLRRSRETYPQRVEEYRVATKNYELQQAHYQEMLRLYQTNYDAYSKRLKDRYVPPQLPTKPHPPAPPELLKRLAEINAEFRDQRSNYFRIASTLNVVAWAAALALAGGLLYLLMFDVEGPRLYYVVILGLSFIFLIGPAFHTILSGIVGFMHEPSLSIPEEAGTPSSPQPVLPSDPSATPTPTAPPTETSEPTKKADLSAPRPAEKGEPTKKVDPNLKYSELMQVIDVFSSLKLTKISFQELTPGDAG